MELLIFEVQKHYVLWNKWNKIYRDRYTTEKNVDCRSQEIKMR